ncbi:MAG TPA: MFS transporter [Acidimicrobiia bacterium]|nr:MFS transporter [Acidimicrobiia bacterium]
METRSRLPHNIVVLSWVSFFQDAASEMLYPVIPLFLTGVLGAPVAAVGLIEGVGEATASAMKIVSGRLADLRRRRPLIAAGYGLSSIAKPLMGLAQAWPFVLFARFVDRTGKGLRTSPRDALIAEETTPALRGRAFGFHRAADTAGAVCGPLIGIGLYELFDHNIRPLFFVAFVPAIVSVGLIGFVHERTRPAPRAEPAPGRDGARATPHLTPYPRRFRRVLVFLTLFGIVNFSDALLILRAKALGLGFVAVVLAYVLYNLTYAGLSYPAGHVSDRVPRYLVFATGLAIFAIAYLGLGIVTTSAWVWPLLAIYGGFTALTDGVGKAWIADLLPRDREGSGLGLYQGVVGAASLLAGIWAGLAWNGTGRLPLVISGTVAAVLAIVLAVTGRRLERA